MIRKLAIFAAGLWLGHKYLNGRSSQENTIGSKGPVPSALGVKHAGDGEPTDALSAAPAPSPGHVPNDLLSDAHPDGNARADDHFRPDPTAQVPPEDRESLRPVTAPAPHDPPGRPDQ